MYVAPSSVILFSFTSNSIDIKFFISFNAYESDSIPLSPIWFP